MTLTNESYPQPSLPEAVRADVIKGMYLHQTIIGAQQITEAVAEDEDTTAYVEELERRADTIELFTEETALPSGDALAAELTRFLRERDRRDDAGETPAS